MSLKSALSALSGRIVKSIQVLYRSVYWAIKDRDLPNKDIVLPMQSGMKIYVRNPRNSLIGRTIYRTKSWEYQETRLVSSIIKPGMVVLDIGAEMGYYTIIFSRLVGESGRVFSFEPHPEHRKYLSRNIEINSLHNVKICEFGLSDKTGSAFLERNWARIEKVDAPGKRYLEVGMERFDQWWQREGGGRVDFAKIDIEGAELNALLGMKETLREYHPMIVVEVHTFQIKRFGFSAHHLINFLSGLGYVSRRVDTDRIYEYPNMTLFFASDKSMLEEARGNG